jgi:cation-transporting ATPase 13A3/4/5
LQDYHYTKEKNLTSEQCTRSLDIQNAPKVYDGSNPGSSMWALCPPPPPAVFTYREPMWIAVFAIIAFEALFLMIWHAYKTFVERNATHMLASEELPSVGEASEVTGVNEKSGSKQVQTVNPDDDDESSFEDSTSTFKVQGFVPNILGTMGLASIILVSIGWIIYLAVIVADYYGTVTGKPYGIAHNDYDLSSNMFICVWVSATVWFVTLNVFKAYLVNYFRVQVNPLQSKYIQVKKPKSTIIMMENSSKMLKLVHKVESFLSHTLGWDVLITTVPLEKTGTNRLYFNYQCTRFVYHERIKYFSPHQFQLGTTCGEFMKQSSGISTEEADRRLELKGPNFISVKVNSFIVSLLLEFTGFFYMYQLMILWLFYYLDYYIVGLVDGGVILISAIIKVYIRRNSELRVKGMAEHQSQVKVLRDNKWVTLSSSHIIPGDVIAVESGQVLSCDAVVISGNAVVDESSLTGEPLPIRKFTVNDDQPRFEPHGASKIHALYAGTTVAQVTPTSDEDYVKALVYETATSTDKGQLVHKILFPVGISFIFDEELKIAIIILGIWGIFLLCMALWLLRKSPSSSWFYGMFCLSQILSPLLPAALVVGQSVAADRLRNKKVYCVDLPRIVIAGKVQIFCFDKTGTLTKEGLEFYGGRTIDFQPNDQSPVELESLKPSFNDFPETFQLGLATCHSVTSVNGTLIGNPVDIEMFKSTEWELSVPESPAYVDTIQSPKNKSAHIVKRFEFIHARASMSVAVLDPTTKHVHIFVKGSFEKLKDLSNPNTLPSNYDEAAVGLAREGCYVLGLAHRDLGVVDIEEVKRRNREELEADVDLIGLIVFKNQLKEDTTAAIDELKGGSTRTVMITGDTALTGVYIARACHMSSQNSTVYLGDISLVEKDEVLWTNVDKPDSEPIGTRDIQDLLKSSKIELAVTGKAFNRLCNQELMRELLLHTRVFARMTPQDKVDCIQYHMERGITAMCGDGGNDCGALRAAHVGLALSESEASIVSPFSSNNRSVQSCVELIREGRAGLATSIALYKYLIMYGETMASLKLMGFYFSTNLSLGTWILIDSFITIGLSYSITQSHASPKLSKYRPTARILGPETLSSVLGLIVINFLFLTCGMYWLFQQPFFVCHEFDSTTVDLSKWVLLADNYEGELISFITLFQFVNSAFIYNFGYTHRRAWYRNWVLLLFWVSFIIVVAYLLLADPNSFGCIMRMNCGDRDVLANLGYTPPNIQIAPYNVPQGNNVFPKYFRTNLFLYCLGNMACGILYELIVIIGPGRNLIRKRFSKTDPSKSYDL